MGLSFLSQFAFVLLPCFFLLPRFNSQQQYVQNGNLACKNQTSVSKGYFCNGINKSCISFLTFRSNQLYDSPQTIASLLGSEALTVASINNVSVSNKFPPDELIRVPISCDCWGNMYQHTTSYTVKPGDTYFTIANDTYQGLTSCQALDGQNYFDSNRISSGAELMIPLRCACPTQSQSANGVIALITYLITWGDALSSIAEKFRVDPKSIEEANQMDGGMLIYPFTPILLPVRSESCGGNTTGDPLCQCPNGLYAYQMPDGHTCTAPPSKDGKGFPLKLVAILGVTIGVALLCVAVVGYRLWLYLWKRKDMIRREKLFKQNGGLMLEQRLSSYGGGEKAKIFAAEELEKATDNFNRSRILGQGGYGTVYKGMLPNGTIVAIKRSKAIDRTQIQQFINEVVILSHINHRNIVRLLGCCLETEFPLLVYEFIPNGTLYNRIHNHDPESMFLWDERLRIACEVAGAVAYMHSAASTPVFHRDIKPSNILLDERHSAKVSDFGTSRSIPNDQTHLTTDVQGTFGYLDPEYFQSSLFTDKSDVYSFGVVLVELLTGEKPVSLARIEEGRNLVAHFISLVKDKRLADIIDPRICEEFRIEDFYAVANIAVRCLRLNGKKRPTMKEVALELERLKKSQTCLQVHQVSELIGDDDYEQSRQGFEEESFDLRFDLESTYFKR